MNQTSPSPTTTAMDSPAGTRHAGDPPLRVAVVAASWHRDIVASATAAIRAEFDRSPSPPERVDQFDVPGAFEIPAATFALTAQGYDSTYYDARARFVYGSVTYTFQ